MSTQAAQPQRPEFGKLYGITHNIETGAAIRRIQRVLKVGLGIAKGRAVQVFIHNAKWHIRFGVFEGKSLVMKTVFKGGEQGMPNTRAAAEAFYEANKQKAEISNRPQKVSYFTFSKRTMKEDSSGRIVESFEPDFDAIEAHGDLPQHLSILVAESNPLHQSYEFWNATALQCKGDGRIAERAIALGSAADPNWASAKAAGAKVFLYDRCYKTGCKYAGKECKPHSTLNLQLKKSLRLGATAYFTSTGEVSAGRLASSLDAIRAPIEARGYGIAGLTLELVLQPFPANPAGGKRSLQPAVSLELRASGPDDLRKMLEESSWVQPGVPQLALPPAEFEPVIYDEAAIEDAETATDAGIADAEFDDDFDAPPVAPAASATRQKQDEISEQLKRQREAVEAAVAPPTIVPMSGPSTHRSDGSPRMPWNNEKGMKALLETALARVGPAAYEAVLERHGIHEAFSYDDVLGHEFYADLKLLPDAATDHLF